MRCFQKLLVLFSSFCLLLSGFVLAADYSLGDQYCFRSFKITSSLAAMVMLCVSCIFDERLPELGGPIADRIHPA